MEAMVLPGANWIFAWAQTTWATDAFYGGLVAARGFVHGNDGFPTVSILMSMTADGFLVGKKKVFTIFLMINENYLNIGD